MDYVCPICRGPLTTATAGFHCATCARDYEYVDGIPDFFVSETEQDAIEGPSQTWLDPEIVEARDTIYRLCTRHLKGMAFCMQQISQRTFPGCRVLEVGMGTGHFTRWMAEVSHLGTEIYAFDFSWPIIHKAQANAGNQPGVSLFRANSRGRLPFCEESFDILFLRLAPLGEHGIPNAQAGFQLLKPGGWLFQAGWEPTRYETPWTQWAIQHGFENAEMHEWRYPRIQTWQEYSASQLEHERMESLGIQIGTESAEQQRTEGESALTVTHEHLMVAQKPMR